MIRLKQPFKRTLFEHVSNYLWDKYNELYKSTGLQKLYNSRARPQHLIWDLDVPTTIHLCRSALVQVKRSLTDD
jgi:hypothetical protein